MNTKKPVKYILSLILAGVLLYISFRGINWADFIGGMQSCRWSFVLLAMAASVLAFYFRSKRWRILIKPFDPQIDTLTTFNGVNIGYLANFIFPRAGEVIRCGFVSRRSRSRHKNDPENSASFENVLGTVLLSRSWDMAMVFILIILLLAVRRTQFGEFFSDHLFGRITDGISLKTVLWAAAAAAILAGAAYAAHRFRHKSRILQKAVGFAKGLADGFKSCLRMKNKAGFFAYTALLWLMYWLMSMSVIWAMPQLAGMTWVDALFICLAGSVAWMIPVPGGFGAYHGVVALAMTAVYGLPQSTGLLYATLNHEAQAITMVVCGLISYAIEVTSRKQI